MEILDHAVHVRLEILNRTEASDIDRHEPRHVGVLLQVRASAAPGEDARQHIDHHREAVPLVARSFAGGGFTQRRERPLLGASRGGFLERLAVLIDDPAGWDGHAIPVRTPDLAVRHGTRRHVQHEGALDCGGSREGDRVRAETGTRAVGWTNAPVRVGDRHSDHVLARRHHGVVPDHANVPALNHAHVRDSRGLRLRDRQFHRAVPAHHAQTTRVGDHGRTRRFAEHRRFSLRVDEAGSHQVEVAGHCDHTVGVNIAQVCCDENVCGDRRMLGTETGRLEQGADLPSQRFRGGKHVLAAVELLRRRFHDAPRFPVASTRRRRRGGRIRAGWRPVRSRASVRRSGIRTELAHRESSG